MARLREQIPWERMTTTVTTRTFKRIKEYVLGLKEGLAAGAEGEGQRVLVTPEELRAQLGASDPEWRFSDAEMMTAVGHLETHGYVTVLQGSAGEAHVLLAPDLLVDLASSLVLLADKHPRELGAVSETELLGGRHEFDELEGLHDEERQVLLDAAVWRFLEHNVCFRETFDGDTLLIFPGLIKQKRPLADDFPAVDDVSYVVRGRVENLYAMLVVLLGYTPSFVRINQWQNQAQYVMGEGEICGFRTIADREGEIELVLYYSRRMPAEGRQQFQELFERFLYQRDVQVTRYPPVACPEGHLLERATVVRLTREGKGFAFCAECGAQVELPAPAPDRPGIGIGTAPWLAREEAAARLRSSYEQYLTRVKGYRRGWAAPRCYLSRAPGQEDCAAGLAGDLQDAGVYVVGDPAQVREDDYVVLLDTPAYQRAWQDPPPAFRADVGLVRARLAGDKRRLISLKLEGEPAAAPEHGLDACAPGDFCDPTHYPVSLLNLVLDLYAIPLGHAAFEPLRARLHAQWEEMPREAAAEGGVEDPERGEAEVRVVPAAEEYVDFDLHVGPRGHATATSREGEETADIVTEAPRNIRLTLRLIEKNETDAGLLKGVGRELYHWLFPGPIHTHFHQTEAVARAQGRKVRLRLRVEPDEIARLPLELLYREAGGYFVATNPDTVLSRYLHLPVPPGDVRRREGANHGGAQRGGGALHLLAIVASPRGQVRLPPGQWAGILEQALAQPLAQGQMTLRVVERATRREIRDALLAQTPDVVQFVGHGAYREGRGYLALVDEGTGDAWWVDDEQFASLFAGHDDHLGLIGLATCESGTSEDPQGFRGIAPRLVQRGVPAVVAMQYRVRIKTAQVFLEEFYAAVAAHKPVDWAAQSARNAVALEMGFDQREFATPVLYMRARDGVVF